MTVQQESAQQLDFETAKKMLSFMESMLQGTYNSPLNITALLQLGQKFPSSGLQVKFHDAVQVGGANHNPVFKQRIDLFLHKKRLYSAASDNCTNKKQAKHDAAEDMVQYVCELLKLCINIKGEPNSEVKQELVETHSEYPPNNNTNNNNNNNITSNNNILSNNNHNIMGNNNVVNNSNLGNHSSIINNTNITGSEKKISKSEDDLKPDILGECGSSEIDNSELSPIHVFIDTTTDLSNCKLMAVRLFKEYLNGTTWKMISFDTPLNDPLNISSLASCVSLEMAPMVTNSTFAIFHLPPYVEPIKIIKQLAARGNTIYYWTNKNQAQNLFPIATTFMM